jgi:hypothetical protein
MKNPTGNKLEKLVFRIFDQMVEGADKYVTKQGSTWLIFTESKKWVIEFTKDKTLWFNYNLFQNELDLIGKDCTEERDLIKNWFESRFLNKPKVKESHHVDVMKFFDKKMENTIKNGVRATFHHAIDSSQAVEDTIQEGVKDITGDARDWPTTVEDTIQNGVKETKENWSASRYQVEDTIQNGVKETQTRMWPPVGAVDETIENGVKTTEWYSGNSYGEVEDTIENGVKDVRTPGVGDLESTMDFMNENNTLDVQKLLDDVIENGVKEAKEDRLFRTIHVMNAIVNGVKHVEDGDWLDQDERIDDIIESGVKETKESMLESLEQIDHQVTNCEITESINDAIENGVKETKEISNISLMSEIFKVKAKQTIRDGVKALKAWKSNRCEDHGYFELVDGIPTYTPMTQIKDVLENGVKEMQPLPAQDGNRDWGLYYQRQGNLTKPHTEYVKEVIEDSYNHMGRVEGVIRNTDKDGI